MIERETPEDMIAAWRAGVREFNRGRHWHAHEGWERGWNRLPEPHRTRIQAMIQVASVIVLLEKGRVDAAQRVARLALEKLEMGKGSARVTPRVSIPGAMTWLRQVAELEAGAAPEAALKRGRALRARLLLAARPERACGK